MASSDGGCYEVEGDGPGKAELAGQQQDSLASPGRRLSGYIPGQSAGRSVSVVGQVQQAAEPAGGPGGEPGDANQHKRKATSFKAETLRHSNT